MSEFIGSRISLVSRSDIRYVGTLHEINSETSTVALENVSSFGTEGRKEKPEDEIPPSDSVYEYIVFRGSDVKDLRIEEAPAVKENKPPQMPNDPAILGSGSRPQSSQHPAPPGYQGQQTPQSQPQPQPQLQRQGQGQQGQQGPPGPPQYNQQYPPPFYPPPPGQWGRGGPPPSPGFQGMPPPPPGWYPPPGQGYPHPGQFPYGPYGPFPPGPPPPGQQFQQPPKPAPIGPSGNKAAVPSSTPAADKTTQPKTLAKPAAQAATGPSKTQTPTAKPPTPTEPQTAPPTVKAAPAKAAPTGPKNGRIMPAVPLLSPAQTKAPLQANAGNVPKAPSAQPSAPASRAAVEDATLAATAAVAAAMAKLPPAVRQQSNGNEVRETIDARFNQLKIGEAVRAPRQPSGDGFRGGRGRGRGGSRPETRKIDVPTTDFDFESSNAKFNKQDLVKEAIAGSPLGENPSHSIDGEMDDEVEVPVTSYNKKSSFFDDLSSETKDRAEAHGSRPGGREWRGEEQKRNLETFGQGSVDNGYRGGFRGRGRGRGGMRGRGFGGNGQPGQRGRGGARGGRDSETFG